MKKEFIPQMQPNFDDKEAEACYKYLKSGGWVTEFKKTREFEKMICDFTGAKYCHVVNNGTISLSIALLALGVKKNDKVIVPNITFMATPNAVEFIGANAVLVDIEKDTFCININHVKKLLENDLNKEIKAVIHVSLHGRCNDIENLLKICKKFNVKLLEDAAQAMGSLYRSRHLGTYGDIGSFSFSPPKIISTGQGGALVTDCKILSDKIYKLKTFGRERDGIDIYTDFGINCKTTDLQSVIGIEQLLKLPWRIKRIKEIQSLYYNCLNKYKEINILKSNDIGWTPSFIDIRVKNPTQLAKYLKKRNIETRSGYPQINKQPYYSQFSNLKFPVSFKYETETIYLPSFISLKNDQIIFICDQIISFINK